MRFFIGLFHSSFTLIAFIKLKHDINLLRIWNNKSKNQKKEITQGFYI